jgi:isopenicillin N synthase-like dioxygenase
MEMPVIDVATLSDPAGIAALHRACIGTGFFYVTNHGVPDALIQDTLREAKNFFALPLEQRETVSLTRSPCNRGYEPLKAQTLEAGTPPDLKEGFYIGNELALDHPNVLAGFFNQGPNQWPAGLPAFRAVMERYFATLTQLSSRLMGAMALSLGLPGDHFASLCESPMAVLRLLHYPPQPPNPLPDEKGCGAHTDWGCLTLLWQDDAGGLQVRVGESWVDAPPIPGTFVVNIADMFARWTNDRYRSTLHRVVNVSGRDRYSIPFFFEGNPQHVVACLPGCSAPDNPPRYQATTVSDHLEAMYRQTY